MKRTEIDHHTTNDGQIHIDDIRNVASADDIEKEFGKIVRVIYGQNPHRYYNYRGQAQIFAPKLGFHTESIGKGCHFKPEKFQWLIDAMKEAGRALQKIVKEERGPKTTFI